MSPDWLIPQWPAPPNVRACVTTRAGGVSLPPYASFNLATHVGDDANAVLANRAALGAHLPSAPRWLNQVHGVRCVDAAQVSRPVDADASFSATRGVVCVVMTADCLPVFFCNHAGTAVAVAHAGWRGLLDGVLEATLAAMPCPPGEVIAWMGPAIGPQAFEVGPEVKAAFLDWDASVDFAFQPQPLHEEQRREGGEKYLCDLYAIARHRLLGAQVSSVHGGGECTYSSADRFFSYRRDGITGRMASLIWFE